MDLNRVIKARIVFNNQNDILKMVESQEAFRQGCNFVSDYIFNNDFPLNATALNKVVYNDLRERFGLKSQMAQSCMKTVIAKYKSAGSNGHEFGLIEFKKPEYDLVWNRDYSLNLNV